LFEARLQGGVLRDTGGLDFVTVAENLRESFRVIAAPRATGEVCELPGVSIASAGVTFQMFNAAFLSTAVVTADDLEHRLLQANMYFGSRGLEWAYWVCDDLMDYGLRRNARRIFERHGLRHSVDLPGMVAERLRPPLRRLPEIEVRRVTGYDLRTSFCSIGSVCFHVPLAWMYEVFDNESVWNNFASYVGFVDGEPVSTTAVVVGSHAAGVYNVATLPGHRRHGYGEAVMRYALAETRRLCGTERTILQSTPQGYDLYEGMGYRKVTNVSVYAS
jgi:ribosomal protein S18 acetylase RimI-like enzyme